MTDKEMDWNVSNSNDPPDPGGIFTDKYQDSNSQISITPNLLSQSMNLLIDKNIDNNEFNAEMYNICSQQNKNALESRKKSDETRVTLYELTDSGPFKVYIESNDGNIESLHPMSLGRILHSDKSLNNTVVRIAKLGNFRVLEVKRTVKRTRNEIKEITNKTPLPVILVTFKGQELPDKIFIYNVSCLVEN
ncbi:hypothetical protein WA026_022942 [Henosepilachna vigintioctopunctata]|uniref:Uncharacterized protein n=1 Tax=Henosepilachna vigintioctopunctata TaxID=420089 RepID=A0AAW1TRV5_9CUCU